MNIDENDSLSLIILEKGINNKKILIDKIYWYNE